MTPRPNINLRVTGHLAALDGLRGLAILGVMLFHFAFRQRDAHFLLALPWRITDVGWIGVDLFFVLSGFLITGLLLDAKNDPHYFRNFYGRRTLRIFPLYYGALAFAFIIWPRIAPNEAVMPFKKQLWIWLYATNFALARNGVDAAASGSLVFHHFWSLAVEEHFYLIWPAVVLICNRTQLIKVCICVTIAALVVRSAMALQVHQAESLWNEAADKLTYCRMDSLAVGAMLAALARLPKGIAPLVPISRKILWIGTVGLIALFIKQGSLYQYDRNFLTVGMTGLAFFFAALLVTCITAPEGSFSHVLLCAPIMRMLGKYSYGLYVFHYPINALVFHWLPQATVTRKLHSHFLAVIAHIVVSMAITFLLAFMSWHLWEKHFLKLKKYFDHKVNARESETVKAFSCPAT